jgi:aminoglycoside phosphotransferase (APT) family kinase protein
VEESAAQAEEKLPHGYTNATRRVGDDLVEKRYLGSRRFDNARRELACLTALADVVPVPRVVESDLDEPRLVIRWVDGDHGQELIEHGEGRTVMRLVGEMHRLLQSVPVSDVDLAGDGTVICHGDFGAQNMLFDLAHGRVAAVIDWESAHFGAPVDDLAFAEWLVRMHHADRVYILEDLFEGAGWRPSWEERHTTMIRKCHEVLAFCEETGWNDSAEWWREVIGVTSAWSE